MKWQVKALIQRFFGFLPYGERLNHMAQKALGSHSARAHLRNFNNQMAKVEQLNERFPLAGKTVMEIGTGWNGLGTIIFAIKGVAALHTYDHIRHLRWDVMQEMFRVIAENRPEYRDRALALGALPSLNAFLEHTNTHYMAPGDAARTGLPDKSVDLVYSYGVLEHVPKRALEAMTYESRRILRPDGIAYHRIGLHDHFKSIDDTISNSNFLKYSEWQWALITNGLSAHNRLRNTHYVEMFEKAGGVILHREEELFPEDIAAVRNMRVKVFKDMTIEELATSHIDVDVRFG
jgi:SAM-dependent methyltransferase